MGAGDTSWNLLEERLLDFDKLGWLRYIENLLYFAEEHDLLLWARLGPVLEQAANHLFR